MEKDVPLRVYHSSYDLRNMHRMLSLLIHRWASRIKSFDLLKNNRIVLQRYIKIIHIYIYIMKQSLYIYIDSLIALEQVTQTGWGTCQGFQESARQRHGWLDLCWWWSCSDSTGLESFVSSSLFKAHFYDSTASKYPMQILS